MTVIACRDGVLAADSVSQWENIKGRDTRKILPVAGAFIGISGDGAAGEKFVKWWANGKKGNPNFKGGKFDALVMFADGHMESWDQKMQPLPVEEPFFAIGAGAEMATGAMEMGATAEQAAAVAAKRHKDCGGEIIVRRASEVV